MAQGGITNIINSPLDVEVGIAKVFTFKFTPTPPILVLPRVTSTYSLNYWTITAPVNGNAISGNINGQTNNTYLYNVSANTNVSASSPSTITATITFGDQAAQFSSITAIPTGNFKDDLGNYAGLIGALGSYTVRVHKIKAPIISPETILDCSNDNVQICAADYDDADSFTWSITGGTIVSGQGSSCITVNPNTNGNVTATCLVKRVSGLSNYTATTTKVITRSARIVNYSVIDSKNWLGIGAGRNLSIIGQNGTTSINWIAPGCTIVGQGTTNATITPTSSIIAGTVVDVYANVTFYGGL
ncbi:hypothetical protein [Flavobacterium restrictum]|uniref:Uncharacterized protein n=1 Tax=Flavobacterium restrictum TaxID=2594428 RepID=A0A553DUB8_9FLAO|nr:hypothetical protein [Flavobacterium restrictum]TRX36361.1 hypothetical protein FNW21_13730 [Flavobacterium restrictum]